MPSDAVTITTALAAPSVAGFVAVVIHRQRLLHERRQGDLATARELLARGAELTMRLDRVVTAWFYSGDEGSVPGGLEQKSEWRTIEDAADEWATFLATVVVLFDEGHPVLEATDDVDGQLGLLHNQLAEDESGTIAVGELGRTVDKLSMLLNEWRDAARQVMRAKL